MNRQKIEITHSKQYVNTSMDWSLAESTCAMLGGRLPNLIYPQLLIPQLRYHIK